MLFCLCPQTVDDAVSFFSFYSSTISSISWQQSYARLRLSTGLTPMSVDQSVAVGKFQHMGEGEPAGLGYQRTVIPGLFRIRDG